MSRGKPKRVKGKASQIGVYIDQENLEWLQDRVRKGTFESISNGIRTCVTMVRYYIEATKENLTVVKDENL